MKLAKSEGICNIVGISVYRGISSVMSAADAGTVARCLSLVVGSLPVGVCLDEVSATQRDWQHRYVQRRSNVSPIRVSPLLKILPVFVQHKTSKGRYALAVPRPLRTAVRAGYGPCARLVRTGLKLHQVFLTNRQYRGERNWHRST